VKKQRHRKHGEAFRGGSQITIEAYQAKLNEITKENERFAFDFGQALSAVRSPSGFMSEQRH
jgi:hypothetical protein